MSRKKNKRKKQKLSSGKKSLLTRRNIPLNKFRIDSELKKALQYHQSGQLHKAEEVYKRILNINPNHSDSLHLLGIIVHQTGKSDTAVNLINKAILNNPKNPFCYNSLGNILKKQGNLSEATSCYEKALELKPNYAEAYNNMGNVFINQDRLSEATSCYEKALELKPDYAEAYNNMGTAFKDQGNLSEAISCYEKALELKPDYVKAYNNMGKVLKDQGKSGEALSCYEKTLEDKPDYPEAYINMGNELHSQGNLSEAISCYEKALELKPDYAEVYNNMGTVFHDQGNLSEAISCYEKALELKPDYAEVYNNMGIVFKDQDRSSEAISYYEKALELNPDLAEAYSNMGAAFKEAQGSLSEVISCYEKALEIKPDCADAYSELFQQLQRTCSWQELERMEGKLDAVTTKALDDGTKTAETPFISLARHAGLSRHFAIAKSWSCDVNRRMSNLKMPFSFDGRRLSKRKVIVGYLSNNFCNHTVAYLMLSLFGLHNRDEFGVFCYSYGGDDGSYNRARIQRDCDKFIDISSLNHDDAAKRIYEDQVDILVDLKGYTAGGKMEICALRPAPVQVRYLGLAGTTGADFFDYIITDRIVMPEDHAQYYSENFAYMPHSYQINDHNQPISNKDWKRADFGLPEDSFVFCSFNQAYKIDPVMFDSWMKILRQVPEGVLWLQWERETAERNLCQEAEARSVEPERLIFSEKISKAKHLARLKLADMALDTRIVNGAATTSDALWAGVPVITLQGGHFASRMSSSILTAIGLPELVTHNSEEYEALAVRLAKNRGELQTIRDSLAKNRLTEPLFDTPRFTRNLEKAYKEMWEIFLAGERPRQVEVAESQAYQWEGTLPLPSSGIRKLA